MGLQKLPLPQLFSLETHVPVIYRFLRITNSRYIFEIRNESGEPVRNGEIGEIWISGNVVLTSYYKTDACCLEMVGLVQAILDISMTMGIYLLLIVKKI